MDNARQVSVIIPVYNVEQYLRACLDSVVNQTLREIEIICVDDGSTDGSGAILDDYAAKDGRVRLIHQPNAGAGMARNAGLDVATGEYLFFCDPDDWCDRRTLAKMYATGRGSAAACSASRGIRFGTSCSGGRSSPQTYPVALSVIKEQSHPQVLVRLESELFPLYLSVVPDPLAPNVYLFHSLKM